MWELACLLPQLIGVECEFFAGKKKRYTDQVHRKNAVKHSNNDSVNQFSPAAPAPVR
ncbi:hypothetical protein SAMN05216247_11052 [Pseudomonas salomonii]|uniref:Uncharacterized protein n=1 Tax=Pseudomonas salomonii TaxID=191391 RepID=A0A1H3SWJ3_9PSED|nr:hypothetical protein SAMN05216247_11052 [Pseudomonas salomonii]